METLTRRLGELGDCWGFPKTLTSASQRKLSVRTDFGWYFFGWSMMMMQLADDDMNWAAAAGAYGAWTPRLGELNGCWCDQTIWMKASNQKLVVRIDFGWIFWGWSMMMTQLSNNSMNWAATVGSYGAQTPRIGELNGCLCGKEFWMTASNQKLVMRMDFGWYFWRWLMMMTHFSNAGMN